MKKPLKKLTSITMILVMALCTLTACGSEPAGDDAKTALILGTSAD